MFDSGLNLQSDKTSAVRFVPSTNAKEELEEFCETEHWSTQSITKRQESPE
ncbi:vacuolar transporter chaperone 1 [Aspergillus luchuensis]|uniref:Vacuolar transporter chaperone 1 n=1 Tax=Aspergillus kawachii TaxID=1069201 RepID=A0A146FL83_ASPKA|nr:vacuolar transporter chaperone 1 [Aspergillus luchuensis]